MARNLLNAGHRLVAYDLVPEAVAALEGAGASAAKSLQDAASGAEDFSAIIKLYMQRQIP